MNSVETSQLRRTPTRFLFLGVISTVVPDSPHKIFIGGLPAYLNEDQVTMSIYYCFFSIGEDCIIQIYFEDFLRLAHIFSPSYIQQIFSFMVS